MGTPLYNTDIIPMTSRPTLTVMDDGDYFVILDTSTGKISKILKTNIQKALNISYDNTTSGLTAETVQAALDELVDNLGSSDSAILALSGRLATLEGTGEGSVYKAIDDAVSPLAEVVDTNRLYSDSQYLELKAKADSLQVKCNTLQAEVYTDDPILQYGATEIIGDGYEADDTPIDVSANVVDGKLSMEQKGFTITNLVKNGDFSLGELGTGVNNGTKTLVSKVLTAVGDGSSYNLQLEVASGTGYYFPANLPVGTQIHITARVKISGPASRASLEFRDVEGGIVITIAPIPIDDNYHVISAKIVTTAITVKPYIRILAYYADNATQATGSVSFDGNYGVSAYNLTALGLSTITDTAILSKLLPYVDGTKNVGKMGLQILDADDVVTQTIFLSAIGNSLPNGTADSIKTVADGWEHTKRVGDGALGAEKVTGGDMSNAGDWVVSVWDVNTTVAGKAYYPDTGTGHIQQSISIVSGKLYCVQFDLSNANSAHITLATTGGLSFGSGIASDYKTGLGNGHHTFYFVASSTQSAIRLYSAATSGGTFELDNLSIKEIDTSTGSPYVSIDSLEASNDGTTGFYQLATPITTHYDLPHLTSGRTIHRFAGEEKIALYGTGLTFDENVLTVLSAIKFVAGEMTDITSLATITTNTVTFSGVNATDVVYVKVEHDVDRPLGILEHTPAVSNTASRLASLEARVTALEA